MGQFKTPYESHLHSRQTLDIIYQYDSFLDSLEVIADFGCGLGLDAEWWATLHTRDDPPEPRNYLTYAIDKKPNIVNRDIKELPNLHVFEEDFDNSNNIFTKPADLVWCHDTFQYITNPMQFLKSVNEHMNVNGMFILIFPQATHYAYNRLQTHSYNFCYYNHNMVNLMYMLAVNGFDCNDAYFKKDDNDPWLYAAVYKSDTPPMDPATTSWYHLAEKNLLNESVVECLNTFGYVKQEEIVTAWLDKDFYYARS